MTRHFVGSTKWRGGFELELIKDFSNTFYLLEVNPRMPAWIYLSVGVEQNIPEALVRWPWEKKRNLIPILKWVKCLSDIRMT
ncbi:MAG: hypothetical protein R2759_14490 [Bacteroidales bacterium]